MSTCSLRYETFKAKLFLLKAVKYKTYSPVEFVYKRYYYLLTDKITARTVQAVGFAIELDNSPVMVQVVSL